jgi:two-component system cell cycle response regulator
MGPKILTVDDSKTIRMIVARAFKGFACEILEASDGVEGLAIVSREKPDIILLDYTMPVMDGFEMLNKLKADPENKSIPVVMLTAEAGRDNVLKIARLGVRDYLVKPFKEELVVERVGRIIDLKAKNEAAAKAKRYDDPLHLLLVDDKPAILEQIRAGLADTTWTLSGLTQAGQAVDFCTNQMPDVILVSLSLPEGAGFMLFQMMRAAVKTKAIPIFALSVKTGLEEQQRAQQMGFNGIITKPIDPEDLKNKVTRALSLDTSYRYFVGQDGVLVLKLPPNLSPLIANDITLNLRPKVTEGVDAGLDKLLMDMSRLANADVNLVKLGINVTSLCQELGVRLTMIGSDAVRAECKNYEETKDWQFASSYEEGLSLSSGKAASGT